MNALETINQARDALTVRRVYGDPYQEEGVTVIPAAVALLTLRSVVKSLTKRR